MIGNIYDGRILVVDQTFHIIKDTYDLDTSKLVASKEIVSGFLGQESSKYDSLNRYIQLTVPIKNAENQEIFGVLLLSVSTDMVRDMSQHLQNVALILQLSVTVALILLAFVFSAQITVW